MSKHSNCKCHNEDKHDSTSNCTCGCYEAEKSAVNNKWA